ncbi:MAG TPA: HEAT repeat domain-containing protein [Bryobacteraceae bacterium]|nr:HEAT repeat domain-containing protein [Bryobacteraceae bacterium]
MSCHTVKQAIPLYHYGELPPEEEERIEQHMEGCEECREELERHRTMAAALSAREAAIPAGLLAECRHELMRAVYRNEAPAVRPAPGVWDSFRTGFTALFASASLFRVPAGAVALIALGFFSARLTMGPRTTPPAGNPAQDVVYSSIRSIQPDAAGRVEIALDETRRRVVSGMPEDGNIRRLLLAAVREEDNPAVRVESVGLLKQQPDTPAVRDVLLSAALHDPNPAVRLKAVEALKPVAAEAEVRKVLAQVLLNDENPGVRIRAIDMLIEHRDGSMVGVLQTVVQRDSNSYVRLKSERALQEMNASVGTF